MVSSAEPFFVTEPRNRVPVLLSVPHCGVEFPTEIAARLKPKFVKNPEDTDWFVHELYGFAGDLGITMIRARFSRYVIDLNRDPSDKKLYSDGRQETELVPTKSFAGESLYEGNLPDVAERAHRVARFYAPYHAKLLQLLDRMKEDFGGALLYDAHSIARFVPTIRPTPFPDLILGDQQGKTADQKLITTALESLGMGGYQISHNDPFQGGYITRRYGRPDSNFHALQLEMSQDVYLDDKGALDRRKLEKLQPILKRTLEKLAAQVRALKGTR